MTKKLPVLQIAELVDDLVRLLDVSQNKFAKMVGSSQGRISQWKNNKGEPTTKNMARILQITRDLIASRKLSLAEKEGLQRRLGAFTVQHDLDRIGEYVASQDLQDEPTRKLHVVKSFDPDEHEPDQPFEPEAPDAIDPDRPASRHDFPKDAIIEMDARAGAGEGETVQHVYRREGREIITSDAIKDDYWRIPKAFLRNTLNAAANQIIVHECKGDSMVPAILPGERVFVDTTVTRPSIDGIYAFRNRLDEVSIKRLHATQSGELKIVIISENSKYPPEEVGPGDITIIGRVVGSYKIW